MNTSRSDRIRAQLDGIAIGESFNYPLYPKEIEHLRRDGHLVNTIPPHVNMRGLTLCIIQKGK